MATLQFAKHGITGFVLEHTGVYIARYKHRIYFGNINRFPSNLRKKERKMYDLAKSAYNHENGVLDDININMDTSDKKSDMTRNEMIMYIMSNPGKKDNSLFI